MQAPKVSVIITTFNRFEILNECIQSVRDQTYKNIEIIVVDDCSTDSRYTSLHDFENVRFVRLEKNMRLVHNTRAAQGATRNEGLKLATGDYICFLDDDDLFHPTKVAEQVAVLESHRNHDVCGTNMNRFTRNPTRHFGLYMEHVQLTPIEPHLYAITFVDMLRCNWVSLSTSMIRRRVLDTVPGFQVCVYEDYEFWKDSIQVRDGLFLDRPLVDYDVASSKHYVYRR